MEATYVSIALLPRTPLMASLNNARDDTRSTIDEWMHKDETLWRAEAREERKKEEKITLITLKGLKGTQKRNGKRYGKRKKGL